MSRSDDTELLIHSRHTLHYRSEDQSDDAEYGHHLTKGKSSFRPWPHVFNLANCIVGVSVLAMPFVFQQCGILLATIMIGVCAVLTKYTCHFLSKISILSGKHSYETLALTALGPTGRRFVELCMLSFLVSSIVAFMVMIGDIGPHIVADYLELEAPTQRLRTLIMVVVLLLVIFPLSLIKDLEKFSIISSFAVLFYAVFVLVMILEALPVIWDGKWSVDAVWWRPAGFLTCLPIICMALSCQTQLFCVMDCIRDASISQVDAVVSGAVNFCSAMYAGVGLFGYVAFSSRTLHGDVLVELESSFLTQLLKLAFMLSIAISIPLMLFPARNTLFNLILRPSNCELPVSNAMYFSTFHVLTFVILLFNLTIALLIPNVEFVLGLTGSLVGSLVNIIIPSVLFMAISDNKKHHSVLHAKICVVAGCFILLVSTWATLQVERTTNVVEKPMPKDGVIDQPALKNLQKLEEKVLDANLNISAKLDSIVDLADIVRNRATNDLLVEMKKQRKEQKDLIRKQKEIVQELHKFVENDGKDVESVVKPNEKSEKLIDGGGRNKKDVSIEFNDKNDETSARQNIKSKVADVVVEREAGVNVVDSTRRVNQSYSVDR